MRSISLAALLLLAACASPPSAQNAPPPVKEPLPSIKEQVEANWAVSPTGMQCQRALDVRLGLAPDGAVKSIELTEPIAPDDAACQTLMQSLRRAILITNRLRFDGDAPPSVLVHFSFDVLQP